MNGRQNNGIRKRYCHCIRELVLNILWHWQTIMTTWTCLTVSISQNGIVLKWGRKETWSENGQKLPEIRVFILVLVYMLRIPGAGWRQLSARIQKDLMLIFLMTGKCERLMAKTSGGMGLIRRLFMRRIIL